MGKAPRRRVAQLDCENVAFRVAVDGITGEVDIDFWGRDVRSESLLVGPQGFDSGIPDMHKELVECSTLR